MPPINHIGFHLRALSNMIKRRMSAQSEENGYPTTGVHGWIIGYIYDNSDKDIFQRDLEEVFSVRRSTATAILQLMEKNGLIIRTPVPYDARLKKLSLTKKAIDMHHMIMQDMNALEAQMTEGLTREELDGFFSVIQKIEENLKRNLSD